MIEIHKKYISWWKEKLNISNYGLLWITFIKRINYWNIFISFFYCSMKKIIAGVDEVGRGSLIGPVYAAAVIFNPKINKKKLKTLKN